MLYGKQNEKFNPEAINPPDVDPACQVAWESGGNPPDDPIKPLVFDD